MASSSTDLRTAALLVSWLVVGCGSDDDDAANTIGTGGESNSRSGSPAMPGGKSAVGGAAGVTGRTPDGGSPTTGGTGSGLGGAASGGVAAGSGGTVTGGTSPAGGSSAGVGAVSAGGTTGGAAALAGKPALSGGAGSAGTAGSAGMLPTAGTGPTGGSAGMGGTTGAGGAVGRAGSAAGALCPPSTASALTEGRVPLGYCAWTYANGLSSPRGVVRDSLGQLLVVESGANAVTLLYDSNGDGVSSSTERLRIAQATGLSHGIALHGGYLYATSDSTLYRWEYDGSRQELGAPETVISGIPAGGHSTRTPAFDPAGNLYLSIGSGSNLDPDFSRARVVRFPAALVAAGGATWSAFEAFADGTRNEVGLRFDGQGRLWGVENGSDNLSRTDLGGDIHNDNPAEELNLFLRAGFYGYPYCWSEGNLPSVGRGPLTQWAYPSVMNDGTHTDSWCRNTGNVIPPVAGMQAHSAPLDLVFYDGALFPADAVGDLFVTFHGSWNRSPSTGYKVVRIPFGTTGMPSGQPEDFLTAADPGQPNSWGHRPVGLAVGARGELFVTSDASGVLIAVGHQ